MDVIEELTGSPNPAVYWRVLKKRLLDEGSNQTVTKCNGFKMKAPDGKMRLTDCANTETMFRLIQSIPSPKAEPFKLWLAKVGYERVQEIENPELAAERARQYYRDLGYDEKWIETRLQTIAIRGQLTDEWKTRVREPPPQFLPPALHCYKPIRYSMPNSSLPSTVRSGPVKTA